MGIAVDMWPALDFARDADALDSLHMQTQVVGKVKLALIPRAAEWQNVPLWVSATGLTTGFMWAGTVGIEIALDLLDHRAVFTATDGRREAFDLGPMPLRDFTARVMTALAALGVRVTINPMTVEVPDPVRCDECDAYDAYDAEAAGRIFGVWARTAAVFEEFRSTFWGKQSGAGLYWGTFDLSVARYNLVPVEPRAGMDVIHRVAMDTEQSEVGFWPGNARYPRAAFFSYTYPKPKGIEDAEIGPKAAAWNPSMGEFLLDYDDMRTAEDPAGALLEFARTTYAAGADLAGWDRSLLERSPPT